MIEKVLIVEDEKFNADRLKRLIGEINPEISILAVLECVEETVEWFQQREAPDLVLMDIRLADGVSFDIFDQVSIECPIIFTTAYDEYAVKAFKYNSVDYILKPVEKEELSAALQKAATRGAVQDNQLALDHLLRYVKPKSYRSRFLVSVRDGYQTVLVDEVVCLYVELKLTKARLKNGQDVLLNLSMDDLEKQLDPSLFFRANRQFVIHIDAVKQLQHYFNRKLKVQLIDPEFEIIVSREKSILLKEWMDC